jgi:predicted nucleic acid-binding protein
MSDSQSKFIDTNFLILAFDSTNQSNKKITDAKDQIDGYKDKKIPMVINSLVIFEMLRLTSLTPERINRIVAHLYDPEYFTIFPIKAKDAVLAADLLREINLNKDINKDYDIDPLKVKIFELLQLNKNINEEVMKQDSVITLKSSDKKTIALNINTIQNINENFVIDVVHFAFCKNNELEYITDNKTDFDNIDIAYKALISQGKVKLKSKLKNIN